MQPTQGEKNKALFRVLYDMAILSDSIRLMKEWRRKSKDVDLNEKQIALNAALVKMRVLHDFLYRTGSPFPDQIFACDVHAAAARRIPKPTHYNQDFVDATNKWCAHLSWDRLSINFPTPTPRMAQLAGAELLSHAIQFVDECLGDEFTVPRTGREYIKRIKRNRSR